MNHTQTSLLTLTLTLTLSLTCLTSPALADPISEDLVLQLASPDDRTRQRATRLLMMLGRTAREALQRVRTHRSLEVRARAASILARRGADRIEDASLAQLHALGPLTSLDLSGCTRLTDAGLAHLGKITTLRELSIAHCHGIADRSLSHLQSLGLVRLNLTGCRLTDRASRMLGQMKTLRQLELGLIPGIAPATVRALRRILPGCRITISHEHPSAALVWNILTRNDWIDSRPVTGAGYHFFRDSHGVRLARYTLYGSGVPVIARIIHIVRIEGRKVYIGDTGHGAGVLTISPLTGLLSTGVPGQRVIPRSGVPAVLLSERSRDSSHPDIRRDARWAQRQRSR